MSRLFVVTILDAPGELDQRLEAAHRFAFVATTIIDSHFNCGKSSLAVSYRLADTCLGKVDQSQTEVNTKQCVMWSLNCEVWASLISSRSEAPGDSDYLSLSRYLSFFSFR